MGNLKPTRSKLNSADSDELVLAVIEALSDDAVIKKIKKALDNSDELSNKIGSMIGHHFQVLKDEINAKNDKICELEKKVDELTQKCDDLEQYSRRNMIRVTGIKENADENTDDLVMKMANELMDTPLDISEIDRSHRVGPKASGRERPILVKLTSYRSKIKLVRNRRKLNSISSSSDILPINGKIYINDDLTRHRAQLLYKARVLKRGNIINDAWSYDGRILVKDKNNKIIPILNERDLTKFS